MAAVGLLLQLPKTVLSGRSCLLLRRHDWRGQNMGCVIACEWGQNRILRSCCGIKLLLRNGCGGRRLLRCCCGINCSGCAFMLIWHQFAPRGRLRWLKLILLRRRLRLR